MILIKELHLIDKNNTYIESSLQSLRIPGK